MSSGELKTGNNELFTSPDVDAARGFFKEKSRALESKLSTVEEVVRTMVNPGDYIAIGGFGANRIPNAIVHELVRQGKKNLGFAGHTSTHDFQVLVAGECFDHCDIAYIIGLEARGLSPAARRYMQSGKVRVTEWTNAALAWRLKAAAMGVSFLPARSMLGTDTFAFSAAKEILCPFTGQKYAGVPALFPDFAAIHVHESDVYGNCRVRGVTVSDQDLAKASKRVVITTERIVPSESIRAHPEDTFIPFWCVDAVIEVPYGCYPGNMPYEYYSDEQHLREWLQVEKDPEAYERFVKAEILDTKDFNEYLARNGGIEKMSKLRAIEMMTDTE